MSKFGIEPLRGAYGRNYSSAKAVLADFNSGKDFKTVSGQSTSKTELAGYLPNCKTINIRYDNDRKIVVAKLR